MENKILVIDDEQSLLESMSIILTRSGYEVITAATGIEGMKIIKKDVENLSMIITDLFLPGGFDGIDVLDAVHDLDKDLPVIMITAYGNVENAVKAMQKGAFNFLTKPVDFKVLLKQIERAAESISLRKENKRLKKEIESITEDRYKMVYRSEKMEKLLRSATDMAKTDETILITGESGTGKELLARHILKESARSKNAFVAFNAAAIHPNLVESELFGYKKGAFTGAERNSPGYIGAAEGGTLFIDEIGDMPQPIQSKLLRFLQEKEYMPVGSASPIKADVRVIAATNRDLDKDILKGRFREDLYYRLSRFTLNIPPLRERKDDISELVKLFFEKLSAQYKKYPAYPDQKIIRGLAEKEWRGNVRELEHFVARYIFSSGEETEPVAEKISGDADQGAPVLTFKLGDKTLKEMEKEIINAALKFTNGNKNKAAQILDLSQRTIYRKITGEEEEDI